MVNVTVTTAGTSGPRGNGWFEGSGAPSDSIGLNGDFYLNQAVPGSPTYYGPKASNTWVGTGPYTFSTSGVSSVTAADTSIVVGGSGSAPTVRTNTLDVIATDHPPAGDWSNNSHKITSLTAGVASTDAVNVSQLPLSTPWVFDVRSYGAVGDGKFVTDGAMGSGVAILTSASGKFASTDVGKSVLVLGAAAAGITTLVTTVASYQSATQVTLNASNSSGGSVSSALVMWATDDTAHIQSAVTAALAYAATNGSAVVRIPTGSGLFYGVAGALVTGSPTLGNSQITLGTPVVTSANKVNLTFEGVANGSGLQHWQQTSPQLNGSTLVSFGVFASSGAQNTSITANGNACVLGGPAQPGGFGVSPGVFSNMLVTLRNLSILTTHSSNGLTYSAVDFSGLAEANLENFAYGTTATVVGNWYVSPSGFANGLSIGVLMPANGNNDNNRCANVSCHGGYTFGFFATEHTVVDRICLLYCWSALCPVGQYFGSVGSTHSICIQQASIEGCTNVVNFIGVGSGGVGPWLFANIDTEVSNPTFADRTSGTGLNAALGTVVLTGLYTPTSVTVNAPTGLKIISNQTGYPVRAVTATTTVTVVDQTILANATSAAFPVTLISSTWTPNSYTIVKSDSSGNAVTVTAAAGQTINGSATYVLSAPNQFVTVVPPGGTGTDWKIVAK
jgi:hypothetical protein